MNMEENIETKVEETVIDERDKYPYNINPFLPQGRLSRLKYFITMLCLGLVSTILTAISEFLIQNEIWLVELFILILILYVLVLCVFAVRKRIMDIVFDTPKSIWFTVGAYILFIIPLINIIVGLIVLLTKGKYDKKLGE